MDGQKVVIGFLLTIIIALFGLLFASEYDTDTFTGTEVSLGTVHENKVVQVESQGGYKAVIESCAPFVITLDREENIPGVPQNTDGTNCQSSYYKIEENFTAREVKIKTGQPEISLSAEIPLGTTVGYSTEDIESAYHNIKVIAGLIWILMVIALWRL